MSVFRYGCTFEREPLRTPFGFKGGQLSELWQSAVALHGAKGHIGVGLGTQSVLWSDGDVFARFPEAVGNALMFLTTAYAAERAAELRWHSPIELVENLLPDAHRYAMQVTRASELRLTFVLNAMVAVDNAAWMLRSRERGVDSFDAMIPEACRPALACRQSRLACVPLISYNVPVADVVQAVDEGCCLLKIKIGADPDKDGSPEKMLAWDIARLTEIHRAVGDRQTPHTDSGRILYYLDANGRYDSRDRLMALLSQVEKIGALDRVLLLEEPFPEGTELDVSSIPVRLAADESAHSDREAIALIQMGYGAIALKPIAKTLSMSLKIANLAHARHVPCFCADLTVSPVLVDWNKNVAARLPVLPGMKVGILESNGPQNYANWAALESYHPHAGASWTAVKDGLYTLDAEFFRASGGIFDVGEHYLKLLGITSGIGGNRN
jgi:L-alanine-DL-glutamate epimerase-like enolase superfamily enzyme